MTAWICKTNSHVVTNEDKLMISEAVITTLTSINTRGARTPTPPSGPQTSGGPQAGQAKHELIRPQADHRRIKVVPSLLMKHSLSELGTGILSVSLPLLSLLSIAGAPPPHILKGLKVTESTLPWLPARQVVKTTSGLYALLCIQHFRYIIMAWGLWPFLLCKVYLWRAECILSSVLVAVAIRSNHPVLSSLRLLVCFHLLKVIPGKVRNTRL